MCWKDVTSAYTWIPAHTTEIKIRVQQLHKINMIVNYLDDLIFPGLKNEGYFNTRCTVTWLNKSGGGKKPENFIVPINARWYLWGFSSLSDKKQLTGALCAPNQHAHKHTEHYPGELLFQGTWLRKNWWRKRDGGLNKAGLSITSHQQDHCRA